MAQYPSQDSYIANIIANRPDLQEANYLAFKLYSRAEGGGFRTNISQEAPLVQKFYRYYESRQESPALNELAKQQEIPSSTLPLPTQPSSVPIAKPFPTFPTPSDVFSIPSQTPSNPEQGYSYRGNEGQPMISLPSGQQIKSTYEVRQAIQSGATNVKEINEQILQRQMESGVAKGYSGTTLTPQQLAKKQLVEQVTQISTPTYGAYAISTQPQSFLYEQPKTIEQATFKPYEQVERLPPRMGDIPSDKTDYVNYIKESGYRPSDESGYAKPISISSIYEGAERFVSQQSPTIQLLNRYGYTPEYLGAKAGYITEKTITFGIEKGFGQSQYKFLYDFVGKKAGEITEGSVSYNIRDIEEHPLKQALLVGAGGVFARGVGLLEGLGGNVAGRIGVGLGLVFGADVAISSGIALREQGLKGFGGELGVAAKDIILFSSVELLKTSRETKLVTDLIERPAKIKEATFDTSINEFDIKVTKRIEPNFFERTILGIKPRQFASDTLAVIGETETKTIIEGATRTSVGKGTRPTHYTYTDTELIGEVEQIPTQPRVVQVPSGKTIEVPSTPVVSEIRSTKKFEGTIDFTKVSYSLEKSAVRVDYNYKGLSNQPTEREFFYGISKVNDDVVKVLGGKIEKVDYKFDITRTQEFPKEVPMEKFFIDYELAETKTVSGRIKTYGEIKIIETEPVMVITGKAPPDYKLFDIVEPKNVKTILTKEFPKELPTVPREIPSSQILVEPKVVVKPTQQTVNKVGATLMAKGESDINRLILQESKFAGTGTYERFSYSELLQPRTRTVVQSNIPSGSFSTMTGQGSISSLGVAQVNRFDTLQKLDQGNDLRLRNIQSFTESIGQSELTKQSSGLQSKQLQKQEQIFERATQERTQTGIPFVEFGYRGFGEPRLPFFKRKKTTGVKQVPTYSVFTKSKGKFKSAATGLTKGQALKLGSERTLTSLSRSFRVVPTGRTQEVFGMDEEDLVPRQDIFRSYKVRRGQMISTPDTFIQRTSANLQTYSEKRLISEARKQSSKFA